MNKKTDNGKYKEMSKEQNKETDKIIEILKRSKSIYMEHFGKQQHSEFKDNDELWIVSETDRKADEYLSKEIAKLYPKDKI